MKTVLSSLVLSIASIISNDAGVGSLNLETHEIGTGQTVLHNWETNYGSYDRTYYQKKQIIVTVRDLSRKTSGIGVHVYFIARPANRNRPLFIYDAQDFSISMDGRLESIGVVGAPDIKSNIQNYAALGVRDSSGAVHDGWIAMGELNKKFFQVRASNQTLLDIAQGNGRQPESLRDLIDLYERGRSKNR